MASAGVGGRQAAVLFVCLGNICRSPTAEAVFTKVVQDAGLAPAFLIDSCGTGGGSDNWYKEGGFSYHEGNPSDQRMTMAASNRDIFLTSRSRPLKPEDFDTFDYIIAMDHENVEAILEAGAYWRQVGISIPNGYAKKVKLMCSFSQQTQYDIVPDPYFGGAKGFELVLDLLEDACKGLLDTIKKEKAIG